MWDYIIEFARHASFFDWVAVFGAIVFGVPTALFIIVMIVMMAWECVKACIKIFQWIWNRGWEWKIPDVTTCDPGSYARSDSSASSPRSSSDSADDYVDYPSPTPGYGGPGSGI